MNIKEWRGLRAKRPVFVLLTPQETEEGGKIGAAVLGGAWPATPRPRRRLEVGGNRAGRRWGPIPPFDLRGGGPQRRRHGGGWWSALVLAVAAPQDSAATRVRGKRGRKPRWL